MKRLETIISPATYHLYALKESEQVVVIIDILRATTTICMAFEHGAKSIIPVKTLEEAGVLRGKGYLLAAERNGEAVEGFDLGNSPQDYSREKIHNKTVVLTTTNGTRALTMAAHCKEVLIGSFLNMEVLVHYLKEKDQDVQLFCAGWKDKFNLEDILFAGAMAFALKDHFLIEDDATLAAMDLYLTAEKNMKEYLQKSSHVKRFKTLHVESDLDVCLKINYTQKIPKYQGGIIGV